MTDQTVNYPSRRQFLTAAAISGAAVATPLIVRGDAVLAADESGQRRRVLRVAHMTDTHIQPELGAPAGVAAALQHVHALDDKPELILTGGDSIMDAFQADKTRTDAQWKLWHQALEKECDISVRSCIGNHDIWGWNKSNSRTTGAEPDWGKGRAVDELKLPGRYYSFDNAGWHFVVLDSVRHDHADPDGYLAFLDDEQYNWLAADLEKTPRETPVLVMSHVPILSITVLTHGLITDNKHVLSGGMMHIDAAKLKDLFKKYSNVKLCLSGHVHLVDYVEYDGVTYCCNGAVCGNWWRGNYKECDEGYALIDLYGDGSFRNQYVAYHWKPRV